jgi:hypothetical protein
MLLLAFGLIFQNFVKVDELSHLPSYFTQLFRNLVERRLKLHR